MRALVLLFAVVALSGCLTADAPDEPGDGPSENNGDGQPANPPGEGTENETGGADWILDWQLLDCRFIYGQASANGAAVAADLPPGFAPFTDALGRVTVGFEANECQDPVATNQQLVTDYTTVWVGVTPPAHLVAESGAGHFVHLDFVEKNETRRELMQASGLPAHDGNVVWSPLTLPEGTEPNIRVEIDMNVDDEFVFDILSLQPTGQGSGAFDQWTPGTDGLTYWRTDWATSEQWSGVGTITIDSASPYSDWFELPVIQANFNYGTWSYTNGKIIHPAPTV